MGTAVHCLYGQQSAHVRSDNSKVELNWNALGERLTIKYRRGKENIDADSLSRNPMDIGDLKKVCTETVDPKSVYAVVSGVRVASCSVTSAAVDAKKLILEPESELSKVTCDELMDQQLKDDVIRPVYHAVAAGVRPTRREWSGLSNESRILMKSFQKMSESTERRRKE